MLVLGRSLAVTMPTTEFRVLVLQDCADVGPIQQRIDGYLTEENSDASHQALGIDQCDWGDFDVESAALFYSVLEFATSVKPALLRSLLGDGWDRVTYLDPDIQVFEDFTTLLDDDKALSLTPHLLSDIPDDGLKPSTGDILQAGFFNMGFCSVRPSAASFLDWWSTRLQFDCLADHSAGYFTDQKIVDLAPLKTDVQIIVEPGCNVAYWNLHERSVVIEDGVWRVARSAKLSTLYFFHFSGYVSSGTPSLSVHATRRVLGDAVPRPFAAQYAQQRSDAEKGGSIVYSLAGATAARFIPAAWNRSLREDARTHVRAGFTLREVREEIYRSPSGSWTKCPTCGDEHENFGSRVRSFLAAWACHPSLLGTPNAIGSFFRDVNFQHREAAFEQLGWAGRHFAENTAPGHEELVEAVFDAAEYAIRNTVDLRLVGYFAYQAGIGRIARWTLEILDEAGIHAAIDCVSVGRDSNEYLSALLRRRNPMSASHASVLCFINADQWQRHVIDPGRVNTSIAHLEAVWAWELEFIPDQMGEAVVEGEIERVHALSTWSVRAMAAVLPVPVQRLSPFDVTMFDVLSPRLAGAVNGSSKSRYVLTSFDAKSYIGRKNPEAVLELWRRVQNDYPDCRLTIKCSDLREFAPADLLDTIDASPRTELIDDYLDDDRYLALLQGCEVFLSLHRSEGMGLTPIEAALCGLPVVYTNYGGVSDFLDGGFFPVTYTPVQVGESSHASGPYDRTAWWAEPDLDVAEHQFRLALDLARDEERLAALMPDVKRLQANLITAQEEVVRTGQRLVESSRERGRSLANDPQSVRVESDDAESSDLEETPNPVIYDLLVIPYRIYQILPKQLRRQLNLALDKLRNKRKTPDVF
ncbi:MAG TPA: glycosyltransferase [Acidimicrobiales bacterium]|nr:glycosyltransferase [Acidimicrobiales bacterium]